MIKSRRMRWAVHVAQMRETKRSEGPEGRTQLGRPRLMWVDNIQMDLTNIGWCGIERIDLSEDMDKCRTVVNLVMNLWVS
jgi:hypothetical protein